MKPPRSPQKFPLAEGLYRLLLLAYPKGFRTAHGTEMLRLFRDQYRDARVRTGSPAALWLSLLRDVAVNAWLVRLDRQSKAAQLPRFTVGNWVNGIGQDVRFAGRGIRKHPGFTLVVIATLAIGIGANTGVFSFVSAILLRSLPYREADRLVQIVSVRGAESGALSLPEVDDLREQMETFESVAAYQPNSQYNTADGGGPPEEVPATLASSELFEVLGTPLQLGQAWPREQDRGESYGVILSHNFWQRRFGSDPNIVGKKITLDAAPFYTVCGVAPPGVEFPARSDLFRSVGIAPDYYDRKERFVLAAARLRSGVTLKQAQAELDSFGRRLEQNHPGFNREVSFELRPLRDLYVGEARPYLWLLTGAVGIVLLIACVNVVNLLLARALAREREMAIRLALGARRGRLIRLSLTESLLLSLLGGVAGLVLAQWTVPLLTATVKAELPPWVSVTIDRRVLFFTLLISVLTGLLAGVAPAWQSLRQRKPNLNDLLKEEAHSIGSGSRLRLKRMLVVAEIALALALLASAGLLVKSFLRLQQIEPGFNPHNLLTFRVALPWKKYETDEAAIVFYQQVLPKLAALPGVKTAAATSNLPLSGDAESHKQTFTIEGQLAHEQSLNPYVNYQSVSPNYFEAMEIPLVTGRGFNQFDIAGQPPAAIVSRRLAAKLWPNADPIGRRLKLGAPDSRRRWLTIVGVSGNVQHEQLTGEAGYDLYVPYTQVASSNLYLLLRASVAPETLSAAATQSIHDADPQQSTFDFATMSVRIAATVWQRRVTGVLFALFAALALILAAVGIYSVMSYATEQRRREIGIRIALGATALTVLKMTLRETLGLVLIGSLAGLAVALALTRLMSNQLYGVSVADPLTFAAAPLLLAVVAFIAGLIPALRAARVDTLEALRGE
jgi:putative ABC transport system permease protein